MVGTDGLFGESSLVSIGSRNETAVTLDKVTLMSWSSDEIEQHITREPRLGLALSRRMVRRCMELQYRIENMAVLKTPERVMLALVMLTNDLGVASADGSIRVRSLTHQTIADFVGTSREIVSGEMNRLRRLGALEYNRKHMDVHPRAMHEQLCQRGVSLPPSLRGKWQAAG
jgi:CRP/FNR family transcriptional regulator